MAVEVTQEELEAGRGYEALFVPALFSPWPDHVLDHAGVASGSHILDVACGTGVLARNALLRTGNSGRVVGLDPVAGMIAAAKEVEPHIEWVLGSAEQLPFEDASFEHVVCQFGMMFFQDPLKAVSEMYRVTKPGGNLAIALWHSIDQNPAYGDIVSFLDENVSVEAGNAVRMPFSMGDPEKAAEIIAQAGFVNASFETLTEQAQFPSTRTMLEVELRGWLPLFDIHLSEESIQELLRKSDANLSNYASPSGEAVFPATAYIVGASKAA